MHHHIRYEPLAATFPTNAVTVPSPSLFLLDAVKGLLILLKASLLTHLFNTASTALQLVVRKACESGIVLHRYLSPWVVVAGTALALFVWLARKTEASEREKLRQRAAVLRLQKEAERARAPSLEHTDVPSESGQQPTDGHSEGSTVPGSQPGPGGRPSVMNERTQSGRAASTAEQLAHSGECCDSADTAACRSPLRPAAGPRALSRSHRDLQAWKRIDIIMPIGPGFFSCTAS